MMVLMFIINVKRIRNTGLTSHGYSFTLNLYTNNSRIIGMFLWLISP